MGLVNVPNPEDGEEDSSTIDDDSDSPSTLAEDADNVEVQADQSHADTMQATSDDNQDDKLPKTVTEIVLGESKLYVVGTAHFSTESQEDVRKTIRKLRPGIVVLELCPSRQNILAYDEETLLREASDISMAKVIETMKTGGQRGQTKLQSVLLLLLLYMSANLTKKLGMAPGGEFRAAISEIARLNLPCQVILGDRPFNVTLSRAIRSLTCFQKVKLAWQFLTSNDDISKETVEDCKNRDILEEMLLELTGEFPSISRVFVEERDLYLAHKLRLSCSGNSRTIVAVVGMGHVPGITRVLSSGADLDLDLIKKISSVPEDRKTNTRKRVFLGSSIVLLGAFLAYKYNVRLRLTRLIKV